MTQSPPSNRKSLLARLRRAFTPRKKQANKVMLIINPASGQGSPDLRTFNRIVRGAGMEWEVAVTNQWGDGARLARQAAKDGVKIVAAYGGDGTIMDVAHGMVGTDAPLAILPGGTGNALAKELNLPFDFAAAVTQMIQPNPPTRCIDLGTADKDLFLLRLGIGLEAEIVRTADRALKDRMGPLAYLTAAVQAWNTAPISRYTLVMDGQTVEIEGLACMIANAGNVGIQGLALAPQVSIDDGLLDVFVIRRADLGELVSLISNIVGTPPPEPSKLPHWQCRTLNIQADPPQGVEADGEELGQTPVKVSVIHQAIQVITPK